MTGAEVATVRHLLGLTLEEFGVAVGDVNPRTVRSWESGRDVPGEWLNEAVATLLLEHDALVAKILDAMVDGVPVQIARDRDAGEHPRGWHVAAAARALDRVGENRLDMMIEWMGG